MDETAILKSLEEVRKSPKRKFKQSIDLVFNLQNIDFKNTANKIDIKITLPEGRGKDVKVGVFGDTDFLGKAKSADLKIPDKQIKKEAREIRKIAGEMDFFIAQTTLMAEIGKTWGKYLSTRGKMPQPMPPDADPTPMIMRFKKTVVLKSKGNAPQTIACTIGSEDLKDQQLAKNAMAVINALIEKLPQKKDNLRSVYIKMTMGPSVKLT
jgi:large subunit ribosomal protein L1